VLLQSLGQKIVSQDVEDAALRHAISIGLFWSPPSAWKRQVKFSILGKEASKTIKCKRRTKPAASCVCMFLF